MGHRFGNICGWLCVFMLFLAAPAGAENLAAEVRLDQQDVFVGEPMTMQIVVSGSESPSQPDLSHVDGVSVSFQGGSQNSSRSISIINGRMTQDVREGYVFSYQITPLREGRIEIPPISVRDGGQAAVTRKVSILAKKPTETDDFKLRMVLSKTGCYVGEPVTLTVTWYLAGDVDTASFSLPFLEDKDRFFVADPKIDTGSGRQYYKIPANSGEIIVEKGQGELDGRVFSTLAFRKVLIPRQSGNLSIDPATVSFKALAGYRNRRDPAGDEFFSNFFNQNMRQNIYRQGVAPSNPLELTVKDLPAAGRLAGFSGFVGEYQIEAEASPTSVSVGDPITLTVAVSGPEFLDPVELPPLQGQPELIRDFKVPSERAAGEIAGNRKIFTQTIRPLRADVAAVPSLALSYFDTRTETYQTARTAPISLTVSPTRVVTEKDAEGVRVSAEPAGSQVETWAAGIAHNYEDDSVLTRQMHDPAVWAQTPAGLATLAVPPCLYLLLFAGTWVYRKQKTDPGSGLSKKAGTRLIREINSAQQNDSPEQAMADILEAFKSYLRVRLRLQPGAVTFQDVAGRLSQKGIDTETLAELESLFADGEAARYGKSVTGGSAADAAEKARNLLKKLDRLC